MKKAFLLLFVLCHCAVSAQVKDLTLHLQQLMQRAKELNLFSGTVLVAYQGKPQFTAHQGYADWERKVAFHDSTRFNVGSNGKDFTKVVVLQLIQEGKLSLEDPLQKYYPIFPKDVAQKVLLRHLLTMQSGMGDYHNDPNYDPAVHVSIQERIEEVIAKAPLLFEPGTAREYSNSGYIVLGGIIEKVTDKSYAANVQERILKPIGMFHTFFKAPMTDASYCAVGHVMRADGKIVVEHVINDHFSAGSDGGMYSTALDLLQFDQSMLHDNRLLTDASKVMYYSDFDEQAAQKDWNKVKANPQFIAAGAGGLPGWNSCLTQFVAAGYTAIVLCNVADHEQPAEEISLRIEDILAGRPMKPLQKPLLGFLLQQVQTKGAQYLVDHLPELLAENNCELPNGQPLNQLGYTLLEDNQGKEALIVFHHNVVLFQRANLWDSLAEGYWKTGDRAQAKMYYEKALEVEPEFGHAREMLEELGR